MNVHFNISTPISHKEKKFTLKYENQIWNLSPMKHYIFFFKKLFLLHFGSCQNCLSSANLVVEIHQKLCNKSFEHWRTMYLWICYFAPIISQTYISIHWHGIFFEEKNSVFHWRKLSYALHFHGLYWNGVFKKRYKTYKTLVMEKIH